MAPSSHDISSSPPLSSLSDGVVLTKLAILLLLAIDMYGVMARVMARDSDVITRGLHVMFRGDRDDFEVLWLEGIELRVWVSRAQVRVAIWPPVKHPYPWHGFGGY